MDWRRNIVRCLMLATLVVAASAPANAALPGFLPGWKPPPSRPVQRPPPVQNNWNTGRVTGRHGYDSVKADNAGHMRDTGDMNRRQIHPSLGYDSYPHSQKPGSIYMGTTGYSTRGRVPGSNTIEKPMTAAAFSKNKYQKSSNTIDYDKIIRTIKRLRRMLDIPGAEKEVDRSYPNSDQEESTPMKFKNIHAEDGKKPWVMVTTPDRTWYFEIDGTWYVVLYKRGAIYWQIIPSTNSSHTSPDEEGIRRREIRRLIMEDLRKAPMTRRGYSTRGTDYPKRLYRKRTLTARATL